MSLDDRLKNILSSVLEVEATKIDENSSSDNLPQWDSLHHMNLILALEEEFGITIPDEEVADLTSYKLIHLVVKELTGNA